MTIKRIMVTSLIVLFSFLLFGCIEDEEEKVSIKFIEDEAIVVVNENISVLFEFEGPRKATIWISSNDYSIAGCILYSSFSCGINGVAIGETEIVATVGDISDTIKVKVISKEEAYGAGTKEDPYRISTKEQLLKLAKSEDEHEGKYFKLMNDISFKPYEWDRPIHLYNQEERFSKNQKGFKGHFDGNYHTINLNKTNYNGLISVNHGVIENLKLSSSFDSKEGHRASLLGFISDINFGKIERCFASGNVRTSSSISRFGGITGVNSGEIRNCISSVNVVISNYTRSLGGITGSTDESGINSSIENCIYLGTINYMSILSLEIGGIVGIRESETQSIKNSYFDSSVMEEGKIKDHFVPVNAIGKTIKMEGQESLENIKNVSGISDWSTIDLNEWNLDIWDFTGDKPKLKGFN